VGRGRGTQELINGTVGRLTSDELTAIITQTLGAGVDVENYIVTVEEGYTAVEIADFDNDMDNDIVASRQMKIDLTPSRTCRCSRFRSWAGQFSCC